MPKSPKKLKGQNTDKNWVKPPNTIVKKGPDNAPHKLSYWIDKNGKYQLYTKEQLATCNILTNLNLIVIRSLVLLDTLKKMDENAKIKTLIRQDYSKFEAKEASVFNHFVSLMAAVPDVTFGEFLGFISGSSNPKALAKMGKKPKFEVFYSSDKLKGR